MQRDLLFLAEMIDAADQAHGIARETSVEDLGKDRRLRDALAWNFTVLGEAAAKISDETKARFPDVPWHQPIRLRNRIVHGYWSIDLDLLHTTASEQLVEFIDLLRAALAVLDADAS
jgi:uncharacterized protein with HEPN domain